MTSMSMVKEKRIPESVHLVMIPFSRRCHSNVTLPEVNLRLKMIIIHDEDFDAAWDIMSLECYLHDLVGYGAIRIG